MRYIQKILQFLGYGFFDAAHYEEVALWKSWYQGEVEGFHAYDFYNGEKRIKDRRTSLNMASSVCQSWADLLLNEKTIISVAHPETDAFVKRVLSENNFPEMASQLLEKTFALGQGAFVCYLSQGRVRINYIAADMIFPLRFENGRILSAAFAAASREGDKRHVSLNIHETGGEDCTVKNLFFECAGSGFIQLPNPPGVPEEVYGIERPLFAMIRPNIANNRDLSSPFGVSVYANAIDALKSCDYAYDAFNVSLRLSRPRIAVTDEAISFDGKGRPSFDDRDTVFYKMPGSLTGEEQIIRDISIKAQTEQYSKAIQTALNLLSQKVGFGKNMYTWENSGFRTATEVVSENDEMYRTLKKHEILLRRALTELVQAVVCLGGMLGERVDPKAEISVGFDGSLIENGDKLAESALKEFQSGIIDREEYFKRVYKLSAEEAGKLAERIRREKGE